MTTPSPRTADDVSTPGARIESLDVLRGFALCGILAVNIIQQLLWIRGGQPFVMPTAVGLVLFERFLSIFAVLFGVGFGLFLDRAASRAASPRLVLARRLAVLAVIGAVHQFFHVGEALLPYALVGLVVLIPLSFAGPRVCLVAGLVALVVLPQLEESYGLTVALLVLGFGLARVGVPEGLARHPRRIAVALAITGPLAVGWAVLTLSGVPSIQLNVLGGGIGGTQNLLPPLAAVVTAIAYCCVVLLLLRTPAGRVLDAVLAPMGRMALTNYLAATVLFLTVGPLLGIDSFADGPAIAGLTVGILVVQAVWSALWLRRFRYGPVEWVWRCLTWGRRAPFVRAT